jgi:hypothetical protein
MPCTQLQDTYWKTLKLTVSFTWLELLERNEKICFQNSRHVSGYEHNINNNKCSVDPSYTLVDKVLTLTSFLY